MDRHRVFVPFVAIVCAAAVAAILAVALSGRDSPVQRLQKRTHYIEKTTPDGKTIPCVVLNDDAITCAFPK